MSGRGSVFVSNGSVNICIELEWVGNLQYSSVMSRNGLENVSNPQ